MTPEGGGVQVTVRRVGQGWTITRSVPNRKTVYKAKDPTQAILKVIRAYGDGVTTRRLCDLFGVEFVRRYRPPVKLLGRTRQGRWVEKESRLESSGFEKKGADRG